VQFANRIAKNPVGRALEDSLKMTAKIPGGGAALPLSTLLKPGEDTFSKQARKLHEGRKFPSDINWFVPLGSNSIGDEMAKKTRHVQRGKDVINFSS
jgi:hypothetical protein